MVGLCEGSTLGVCASSMLPHSRFFRTDAFTTTKNEENGHAVKGGVGDHLIKESSLCHIRGHILLGESCVESGPQTHHDLLTPIAFTCSCPPQPVSALLRPAAHLSVFPLAGTTG